MYSGVLGRWRGIAGSRGGICDDIGDEWGGIGGFDVPVLIGYLNDSHRDVAVVF
jgi:hypothetical protein